MERGDEEIKKTETRRREDEKTRSEETERYLINMESKDILCLRVSEDGVCARQTVGCTYSHYLDA